MMSAGANNVMTAPARLAGVDPSPSWVMSSQSLQFLSAQVMFHTPSHT